MVDNVTRTEDKKCTRTTYENIGELSGAAVEYQRRGALHASGSNSGTAETVSKSLKKEVLLQNSAKHNAYKTWTDKNEGAETSVKVVQSNVVCTRSPAMDSIAGERVHTNSASDADELPMELLQRPTACQAVSPAIRA